MSVENKESRVIQFYEKYSKLNFIDKPSHLICGICEDIFQHPHQTNCGCRFCDKCFDKLQNCVCPDCDYANINKTFFDKSKQKEVMKLKVRCPHESCDVFRTLKEIIDHVDNCVYRMVKCSMCNGDYQFKSIKNHEDNECPNRQFECTYCSEIMTFQYYNSEHINPDCHDLCEKYSINKCPNKCSTKGFIGNLREHLKICFKAKQNCPLLTSNCSNCKFNEEELKAHFDKNLLKHNQYLMKQIEELKLEIKLQNEKLQNAEVKNSQLESDIKRLNEQRKITNMSLGINCEKYFVWKIDNFHEKRCAVESECPVSFTSDQFYTSEFGYKMCLKIYPAGDGIGSGSHLSVYFVIMKGDFDNVLSWPFKHKVTLELLDQEGNGKHHSEVFKPDETSICYKKPEGDMNIGIGNEKFFMLNKLNQSNFYKDDTIFIKINIK